MRLFRNCGNAIAAPLLVLYMFVAAASAQVVYVDQDATGNNDGTTWANAYGDLQDALDAAQAPGSGIEQIWVAEGTYLPDGANPGDRTLSFELVEEVALLGGFDGTEQFPEDRDPATNITILSGDLNGDDTPEFGNRTDNSIHVVTHFEPGVSSAVIDGFTIRGGYDDTDAGGAGLVFSGSGVSSISPTISQCTITDNVALERAGGGVCSHSTTLIIEDSIIRGNLATDSPGNGGGGGIGATNAEIRRCLITENEASPFGGGLFLTEGAVVVDSIISDNTAADSGGGLYCRVGYFKLVNCDVRRNTALAQYGGGIAAPGFGLQIAEIDLSNCIVALNYAKSLGGAVYCKAFDHIVNCTIVDNESEASAAGGIYIIDPGSNDLRFANNIVWGNECDPPQGPDDQESAQLSPTISNSIVKFNNIMNATHFKPGNIDIGPAFIGGYRLSATSPMIDAGLNARGA